MDCRASPVHSDVVKPISLLLRLDSDIAGPQDSRCQPGIVQGRHLDCSPNQSSSLLLVEPGLLTSAHAVGPLWLGLTPGAWRSAALSFRSSFTTVRVLILMSCLEPACLLLGPATGPTCAGPRGLEEGLPERPEGKGCRAERAVCRGCSCS